MLILTLFMEVIDCEEEGRKLTKSRGCRCLMPDSQTQNPEDGKQLFSVFVSAGLSRSALAQKEGTRG